MSGSTVGISSAASPISRQDVAAIARHRASHRERREPSVNAVTERPIQILWIDDDLRSGDGSVVLLRLEGFSVECAVSGREGLRAALSRSYAGIVLDLRLPDLSGLNVLAQMAAADVRSPVLVLTGFGEIEIAVAAMKLGATDFKEKPLIGEELVQAVSALTALDSGGCHNRGEVRTQPPSSRTSSLAVAAQHLADKDLTPFEFIALARAFRSRALSLRPVQGQGSHPLFEAGARLRLQTVLMYLESAIADKRIPSESECAVFCDVTPADLCRLLRSHLRVGFNECRRALRVRPTVRQVAFSLEQMAQIAFSNGYDHSGRFTRDFCRTLGLTPKQFRCLCVGNSA